MKKTENNTGLFTRITITPETLAELDELWRECTTNDTVDAYLDYLESKAKGMLDEDGYPSELKPDTFEEFRANPSDWLAGWRDEDMDPRARDCRDALLRASLVREARQRGDVDMAVYNAVRMQAAVDRAALRPFEKGVMGRKRGGQRRHKTTAEAQQMTDKCAEHFAGMYPEMNHVAITDELEPYFNRQGTPVSRRTILRWIKPHFPERRSGQPTPQEKHRVRTWIKRFLGSPK